MLTAFLDANELLQYDSAGFELLACAPGFLVNGYQGLAAASGIVYLDVSSPFAGELADRCIMTVPVLCIRWFCHDLPW